MSSFPWPEAVVVLSSRTDVVAGTSPEFVPQWDGPHIVSWHEGGHDRVFLLAEVLSEDRDHYKFRDQRGDTFELRPLTLELYEKHVRKHTMAQAHFDSEKDLLAAMRREW